MRKFAILCGVVLLCLTLTACGDKAKDVLDLADSQAVLQHLLDFDREQSKEAGRLSLGAAKTQSVQGESGAQDFYLIELIAKLDPNLKYGGMTLPVESQSGGSLSFNFETMVESEVRPYMRELLCAIGLTQKNTEIALTDGLSASVGKQHRLYLDGFVITCETQASVLNKGETAKSLYVQKPRADEDYQEGQMKVSFTD